MRQRRITIICFIFLLLLESSTWYQKEVYCDSPTMDFSKFFVKERGYYEIRYNHRFKDTLFVPQGSTLFFTTGSLCGPIVLNDTFLDGNVRLNGSSIKGKISNIVFDASWLCNMDGETDDAYNINMAISVSDSIYFPKGTYLLSTQHIPSSEFPGSLRSAVSYHLGINRSNVKLEGQLGCVFLVKDENGTLCLYSNPGFVRDRIRNIRIKGIQFAVKNNGVCFHEFYHTIKTCGVDGLIIENCFFNDFWGDAICLSHYGDNPITGERTRNSNVSIVNNIIVGGNHHSNRNGISVISGVNVLIEGNLIKETSRSDMPGAIDLEPNNESNIVEAIVIRNNRLINCKGTAGGICVHSNSRGGVVRNVEIVDNYIKDCFAGISIVVMSNSGAGGYIISNNIIDIDKRPFQFIGEGKSSDWLFENNSLTARVISPVGGKIQVRNLRVK